MPPTLNAVPEGAESASLYRPAGEHRTSVHASPSTLFGASSCPEWLDFTRVKCGVSPAIFEAGDILIFVRDEPTYNTEMTDLGVTIYTADFIYTHLEFSNTGDSLLLKTATKNIDGVVWGSATLAGHVAWTGTIDDTLSLQRDPANKDTDDCSVDFIVDTPNPGVVYIKTNGFPGFTTVYTLFALFATTSIIFMRKKK